MGSKKAGLLALGAGGLLAGALAIKGIGWEARVTLHPCDLPPQQIPGGRRTWRGPGHLLHHLWEMALLAGPLASVYLLRSLDPAFRERIMLVTAWANECPW